MVYNASWLPKGKDFLPDYSEEELKRVYKCEKNPKAKVRLLAAMARKEGETLRDIGGMVKHPHTTVRGWLLRMNELGLGARYSKKQPGNKPKLSSDDLVKLKRIMTDSPENYGIEHKSWTTKAAQYVIHKEFGPIFTLKHVGHLLKKIGLSLQKPRPEHRKANKKLQEKFKAELKKKSRIMRRKNSRS